MPQSPRLDQCRLIDEISLVDDDGEPLSDVRRVPACVGRQSERCAPLVDPCPTVGEPEPDLERRVADGLDERVAHAPRLDPAELDDQVADGPPCPVHEEHPRDAEAHPCPDPDEVEPLLLVLPPEIEGPEVGVCDEGEDW